MAFIALKWFAGMVPRLGNQHLKPPHATEAENCNLYSGELRPLNRPALAHKFCVPGDTCFITPKPEDPSIPPEPPLEPPLCVSVTIVTQPTAGDLSLIEGGTPLTLTVIVNSDATVPVQYQWLQDNQALPGEVGPVFDTVLQPSDSFTSFTVFVQNPCGEQISLPVVVGEVIDQPFCKLYECDAFISQLNVVADNVWPMDDDISATFLSASSGGINLPEYGAPHYGQPSLMPGSCVGDTAVIFDGFGGWRDNAAPSKIPVQLTGSMGLTFAPRNSSSISLINAGFYNDNWVYITLQYAGSSNISVTMEGQDFTGGGAGASTETWVGALEANKFTFVNYTLNTDGTYSIELFVDFVSKGSRVGLLPNNATFALNSNTRFIFGGNGNGAINAENSFYSNSRLSTNQISTLKDSWNQNQIGYVDPNPNCRPPT